MRPAARRAAAELVGTFVLVAVGTLPAAMGSSAPVVALAFGLALTVAILVTGGGNFNPAITLVGVLEGVVGPRLAVVFVVAQVAGAVAASAFVLGLTSQAGVLATTTSYANPVAAAGVEVAFTAILAAVALGVGKGGVSVALVIGVALTGLILAAAPISGGSFNPARSLGPALVAGTIDVKIVLYLVCPFVGALVGRAIHRTTFSQ